MPCKKAFRYKDQSTISPTVPGQTRLALAALDHKNTDFPEIWLISW
jgi:hypothetical protein